MNVRSLYLSTAAAGCVATVAVAQEPGRLPLATGATANQQLADSIATRLTTTGAAQTADVGLSVVDGVVTVTGTAKDAASREKVIEEVRQVPGVKKVRDGLTTASTMLLAKAQGDTLPPGLPVGQPIPGAGLVPPGMMMPPAGMPGGMSMGMPGGMPVGPVAAPSMGGVMPSGPFMGGNPAVEPMGLGQPGMGTADLQAPPLPPYAWPTYAPHNNVSRVGYPQAYPYNAFPFIGPFYPFPKVPLGWRKVTLEWEDGHWWIGKTQAPQDYWRVRFW